jgi:hypothetical protein
MNSDVYFNKFVIDLKYVVVNKNEDYIQNFVTINIYI